MAPRLLAGNGLAPRHGVRHALRTESACSLRVNRAELMQKIGTSPWGGAFKGVTPSLHHSWQGSSASRVKRARLILSTPDVLGRFMIFRTKRCHDTVPQASAHKGISLCRSSLL